MNQEEWLGRLKTPGALLAAYFIAPPITAFALGPHDALFARAGFSDLLRAGLGWAALRGVYAFKGDISQAVIVWLSRFHRPPGRTGELTEMIMTTGGTLLTAAVMLPAAGPFMPGWLAVTLNMGVIAYCGFMVYGLWRLYEPFVSGEPGEEAATPAPPPPPPAAERRCPHCGQRMDAADTVCAFCRK